MEPERRAPVRLSGVTWMALGVLLVGLLFPAGALVEAMAPGHRASRDDLAAGFVWLRAALIVTGLVIGVGPKLVRRLPWVPTVSVPLVLDGRERLGLLVVLVVALVVRFVQLNSGLWLDEIDTLLQFVPLPLAQIVTTFDSQNNHPLYSVLARLAWDVGGERAWIIRLPAVLLGVASLGATFHFARRNGTALDAWLATGLLAFSYHHVWFSQNARGYTGLMLCTVVGTELLRRLLAGETTHPGRTAWAYAAVMAIAAYTHLTAVLIVVGHFLVLLVPPPSGRDPRMRWSPRAWAFAGMALAALLTVLCYAPLMPQMLRLVTAPTMPGVDVQWRRIDWMVMEALRSLTLGAPGALPVALAVGVVLLLGVRSWARQDRQLTVLMLAPLVVTAVAVVALRHNLWPRFFFFGAPFLVLMGIRGGVVCCRVLGSRGTQVAWVGGAMVVLLSGWTVPRAWGAKQDFPAAAAIVTDGRRPGDAIATLDIAGHMLTRYTPLAGAQMVASLEELTALEQGHDRTWVVYTFPVRVHAILPAVAERLASPAYRSVAVVPATVGGGEIHILIHERP